MGEEEIKTTLRFPVALKKMADHACIDWDMSFNEGMIEAIKVWLASKTGRVPIEDGLVVTDPAEILYVEMFLKLMRDPELKNSWRQWLIQEHGNEARLAPKKKNG